MHITVTVDQHYDWEPVPPETEVTPQDVSAGRVRPGQRAGTYDMRVQRKVDTHTFIALNEETIIATIVHAYTEHGKCGVMLTRAEAIARHLSTVVMPNWAHPKWMKGFEIHDDAGPNEAMIRRMVAPHLLADHGRAPGKNIEPSDLEEMVATYMQKADTAHHVDHLHKHFKVKQKKQDKGSP